MTKKIAVFLFSGTITYLFLINFCALVYACGCVSMWNGGADHCNIHTAGVHHCPWCSIGDTGFQAVQYSILAVQAFISLGPFRWNTITRLAASLIAFPVAGSAIAAALGVWQGYWK